ncbi:MAG: hypothetical protein M0C28_20735 [Candidatus Moduliflexus flocculans]|nr:hypothetical protein [Candidatus Moduliflexus flocculans]
MNQKQSRRSFLGQCAKCGGACLRLAGPEPDLGSAGERACPAGPGREAPDLATLAYCGIPQAYCENKVRAVQGHPGERRRAEEGPSTIGGR